MLDAGVPVIVRDAVAVNVGTKSGFAGTSIPLTQPDIKAIESDRVTIKQPINFFIFTSLFKKFWGITIAHEVRTVVKARNMPRESWREGRRVIPLL